MAAPERASTAAVAVPPGVPAPGWPPALHPHALAAIDEETPWLVCDLDTVVERYRRLTTLLPGVRCHYALKCNPSPEVLGVLAAAGSGFEVASAGEAELLASMGVPGEELLYSHPVKPEAHVARAHALGVWRFAFDSEAELRKIALHAPGSAVFVRLLVDDGTSVFPLSRKLGTGLDDARRLMGLAPRLGLRPYGVTFHVGSQCTSTAAWRQALARCGSLLSALADDGIDVEMLDLGGGFPARYNGSAPSIEEVTAAIVDALGRLPEVPRIVVAEPGRHLLAESAVLATTVIARVARRDQEWLYVDVGAYSGLVEARVGVGLRYPLWTSRPDHAGGPGERFTVTGPSCDSYDTLFFGAELPSSLEAGDRLYVGCAGAYTLSYAASFNGFPPPVPLFVGGATAARRPVARPWR